LFIFKNYEEGEMKSSSFKLSFSVAAKPEEVFTALTDAKLIAQWSGQKGKVASKVGGKFEMFDGWVRGRVLEFIPSRSLSYTWLPGDWPEEAEESVVKYRLTSAKKGTKVVLEHSNFPNEAQKKSHKSGWKEFVFDPLKDHFSTR
jgi:uncharacterized protein YndB with AHSA1/START domain